MAYSPEPGALPTMEIAWRMTSGNTMRLEQRWELPSGEKKWFPVRVVDFAEDLKRPTDIECVGDK